MKYDWIVYDLERMISDGMVYRVVYGCEASHDGHDERSIHSLNLTTGSASDSDFIDYNNLTPDIVLGWITGSIDQSVIETSLSSSIANNIVKVSQITSSIGTPWD